LAINIQFLLSILGLNLFFLPIWFFYRLYLNKKDRRRKVSREIRLFVLVEYFVCLAAVTIVPLPFSKVGTPYLNLDFFHQTYYNFLSAWNHTSSRTVLNESENLLGNVILFLPMGFLLPLLFSRYRNFILLFLTAFFCSFSIEAIQYFISINWGYNRIADIDDLVLNVSGALLGYFFYFLFNFIGNYRNKFK
jgi:glycopeptide antibiotics resistance protein